MSEYDQIRGNIECINMKTCSFRINKAYDTHASVWKVTAHTVRLYIYKKNEKNAIDLHNDEITPEVFLYKLYIH